MRMEFPGMGNGKERESEGSVAEESLETRGTDVDSGYGGMVNAEQAADQSGRNEMKERIDDLEKKLGTEVERAESLVARIDGNGKDSMAEKANQGDPEVLSAMERVEAAADDMKKTLLAYAVSIGSIAATTLAYLETVDSGALREVALFANSNAEGVTLAASVGMIFCAANALRNVIGDMRSKKNQQQLG